MLKELLTEFNGQLAMLGKPYYGMDTLQKGINRFNYKDVEIITFTDTPNLNTIGFKRNKLKNLVKAKYMAFFDDDDLPATDYFFELFYALKKHKDVDCCSLRGLITTNGSTPALFEHSTRYTKYATNNEAQIKYERYPNHLNLIKSSIAKQFNFPGINNGEDTNWATQIFNSNLIKTEAYINKTLYFYRYSTRK